MICCSRSVHICDHAVAVDKKRVGERKYVILPNILRSFFLEYRKAQIVAVQARMIFFRMVQGY